MITKVLIAIGAGAIAGIANVIAIGIINNVIDNPQFHMDKLFLYKQVFWGALWALLYCFTFFKQNWLAKGFAVSLLATLFTFFVFQSIPFIGSNIIKAIIVNIIVWNFVSSWLYHNTLRRLNII